MENLTIEEIEMLQITIGCFLDDRSDGSDNSKFDLLYEKLERMKAAQQGVQPTAAGGSDAGKNSESGGG